MDLSALIFVVLALAWGVYLIPKALQHHDEVAAETLEESHSDRARVLPRRRRATEAAGSTGGAASEEPAPTAVRRSLAARLITPLLAARARRTTRAAGPALSTAGRAARKRRRVLQALCTVLAVTWGLTWFAYLPAITPLWPSIAVVAWLVVARMSVVKMQRARRTRPARSSASIPEEVAQRPSRRVERVVPVEVATTASYAPVEVEVELPVAIRPEPRTASELQRLAFDDRPEVVAEREALADDGSLWDPLPLTLPTYVGKATARRTVRTIELTGMTSSGHDEADSALAREAEAAAAADAERLEVERQRRVAGA